jgi:hypothetical protein
MFSLRCPGALYVTQHFLQDKAEVLPLAHPERNFFAIHVTNAIDAIDYDRAVIKKLSTGLRLEFEKYETFVKEKVERENIFRVYLDESLMWMVFVSDAFKKVVESNNLSGFKFIEVWDSEI